MIDLLEGEGQEKTIKMVKIRHLCAICEAPAILRKTFLFANSRRNPASQGYKGDDISYCVDDQLYLCGLHKREEIDSMDWCSTFTLDKNNHEMFLHWVNFVV
jgi:hypothetical protein